MQYQVPQFIEVEDKIFGPLTFKQFIYLAGGAGVVAILATFLPLFLALTLATPVVVLSLALAFYRINDRPFINVLEAALNYSTKSKLYIWEKKEPKKEKQIIDSKKETAVFTVPKYSESKLKDLAWSLDIKENLYANVKDPRGKTYGKE